MSNYLIKIKNNTNRYKKTQNTIRYSVWIQVILSNDFWNKIPVGYIPTGI